MTISPFVEQSSPALPTIDPSDPRLHTPPTLADMRPLGGLVFDPASGRWTVRTDLDLPLDPDQDAMARALLARDNPANDSDPFRSKANAYVACRRLARRAECEHGDEARAYCVFCGQKLLCRSCGTGHSLMRQLKRDNIELYALVNASRHQVQTFSIPLGGPCTGPFPELELEARFKLAKFLYRKLKAALDRQAETPYGAKFFPILDPSAHDIGFRVLWIDMPRTLHKIRSMWEAICLRNWKRIVLSILKARGIGFMGNAPWVGEMIHHAAHQANIPCAPSHVHVASQQYETGSAAKSLTHLLSGLEPVLTRSAASRLRYAEVLFGKQLGITTGLLRGKALEDASEGLWEGGIADDDQAHGECSTHHTPLKMSAAPPAPVSEIQRLFVRVWFGPIAANRVKPLHAIQTIPTVTPSPPS